jgi:hypothetical protein
METRLDGGVFLIHIQVYIYIYRYVCMWRIHTHYGKNKMMHSKIVQTLLKVTISDLWDHQKTIQEHFFSQTAQNGVDKCVISHN